MAFFKHTNQEKINLVRDLSVSATHSREICGPVLPTLLRNGHKQTLLGETMN